MHNDPTEPQRAIGAIEPLQGVYRNPYEPLSPYVKVCHLLHLHYRNNAL